MLPTRIRKLQSAQPVSALTLGFEQPRHTLALREFDDASTLLGVHGGMTTPIEFRVRLGVDDWDERIRVFRCSALAIPLAKVLAVQGANGQVTTHDFESLSATRELRYRPQGPPPSEIVVTMKLDQTLTTRRKASASTGAVAIATAIVTGLTQYFVAVAPEKIKADTERRRLEAQLAASPDQARPCKPSDIPEPSIKATNGSMIGSARDHSEVTISPGVDPHAPKKP